MITVQRKYNVVKTNSLKELQEQVNLLIQKEYKDLDGFIYQSSGRWQCLGSPFCENDNWFQALVFVQDEA